ncbi:MAG: GAF domain-containing protein [Alphaproteobacteria bacterium]
MAETLTVPKDVSKDALYRDLLPQIESVLAGTTDMVANMANVAAILKTTFDFHWVGFYRAVKPDMMVLGPFQGPLACVEIPFTKGVCGAAARTGETVVVPDVEKFPGHIACSSLSKSEIVVPGVVDGKTIFVLDVDSDVLEAFDDTDKAWLEKIVAALVRAGEL